MQRQRSPVSRVSEYQSGQNVLFNSQKLQIADPIARVIVGQKDIVNMDQNARLQDRQDGGQFVHCITAVTDNMGGIDEQDKGEYQCTGRMCKPARSAVSNILVLQAQKYPD